MLYLFSLYGIMEVTVQTNHQTNDDILAEWSIIQKAQQDPALFATLYSKYFHAIYRFVLRRIEYEAISEDITTMTFSKALDKLPQYKFKGVPFSAWLYRIALNEIQTYYRRTQKERVVCLSSESLNALSQDLEDEDLSIQHEREALLMKCLEQLNAEEMLLIEMRFFENRSFKEIGEIHDITENNAKVKTYRIIERLRKLILLKK